MSNTTLAGGCPAPFLNEASFPRHGGFTDGRFCAPLSVLGPGEDISCCLPCPSTDYIYPRSFVTWYRVAESLNALGIALCVFLLLTYAVLPAEKTRRHYLSVCLVIAVIFEALGFVIPLGVRPDQCYNEITPNDMYTNMTCAWSGALIVFGGLAITVWIFVRALSMHLQICWDVVPGRKFFYGAQAGGWGIVALFFAVTTAFTGFSFRFGDACHVNSLNSIKTFWGPLLGIAGISWVLQAATFGYCINVYLRNMWSDERTETSTNSPLPSYTASINTHSAKAVYRRVRKVVWLQWRSMLIVVFILTDVVFFSVVFVWLNNTIDDVAQEHHVDKIISWIACLVENGKGTPQCFELGQHALVNQGTVIAILLLLALAGTQCFILLARPSMFTGWYEFFRSRLSPNREFVSVDAKRISGDKQASYELFRVGSNDPLVTQGSVKTPETVLVSPIDRRSILTNDYEFPGADTNSLYPAPVTRDSAYNSVYSQTEYISHSHHASSIESRDFLDSSRSYTSPTNSFSAPKPPSQASQPGRGPRYSQRLSQIRPGGPILEPPDEEDDIVEITRHV